MRATVSCPSDGGVGALRIEGVGGNGDAALPARASVEFIDPEPGDLLEASLACCTARTIERYARRNGWRVDEINVDVDYEPAQRGSPTRCTVVIQLPECLSPQQRERLMQVGATSSVHRTLEGEVVFEERIEPTSAGEGMLPSRNADSPPRRIALLNGLRGALRTSPQ